MRTMNQEVKKAVLEARRRERERRLADILARIEARREEHEQKLDAVRARIAARREERDRRKAGETPVKAEPDPEFRAMKDAMLANVPVIHFPEDDRG